MAMIFELGFVGQSIVCTNREEVGEVHSSPENDISNIKKAQKGTICLDMISRSVQMDLRNQGTVSQVIPCKNNQDWILRNCECHAKNLSTEMKNSVSDDILVILFPFVVGS